MSDFKAGTAERVSNAGLTLLNKTAGMVAGVVGGLIAGPVSCAPAEGILLFLGAPMIAFGVAVLSGFGGAIFGAAHGLKFGITNMFSQKALDDLENFNSFRGRGLERHDLDDDDSDDFNSFAGGSPENGIAKTVASFMKNDRPS